MKIRRRHLLVTAASALLVLALPGPVAAIPGQASTSWGIVPGQREGEPPRPAFLLDLVPGVDVKDVALIVNDGEDPLAVDIYAADAESLEDGSFVLRASDEPKEEMGAWIELPFTEAVVEPGKALPVPFTVHVPENVEVGDHSGGIVAIDAEATSVEQEGGAALGVKQGVGVRVHGRVIGPSQPGIEVVDVSVDMDGGLASLFGAPTTATVTYTIRNSGNLRISPIVSVEVGGLGPSRRADDRQVVDFLPGATATLTEDVSGVWPTGPVTAKVTATAEDRGDSASRTVWIMPWILVGFITLGVVLGLRWRRRRRQRRTADRGPSKVLVGAQMIVLLAAPGALVGTVAEPAGAKEPPIIELSTREATPGDLIGITGRGWPAGELVHVVVCGNGALNGSADCSEQGYTLRMADGDGTFSAGATLVRPPRPCPCVLKASSLSAGPVLMPIEMAGVETSPPVADSPRSNARESGLEIVAAEVEDRSGLASLFGAPSDATLLLTVRNNRDVAIEPGILARWGKGSSPSNAITPPDGVVLDPGESVTLAMPFELSMLSFGSYNVAAEVNHAGQTIAFTGKTSHWPWGLVFVALVALQLVLLQLRNRLRRRVDRSESGSTEPAPSEQGAALPVAVTDVVPHGPQQMIDLRDEAPLASEGFDGFSEAAPSPTPAAEARAGLLATIERSRALIAASMARSLELDAHHEERALMAAARAAASKDLLEHAKQHADELLATATEVAAATLREAEAERDAARREREEVAGVRAQSIANAWAVLEAFILEHGSRPEHAPTTPAVVLLSPATGRLGGVEAGIARAVSRAFAASRADKTLVD